jgi:hypothetical protein
MARRHVTGRKGKARVTRRTRKNVMTGGKGWRDLFGGKPKPVTPNFGPQTTEMFSNPLASIVSKAQANVGKRLVAEQVVNNPAGGYQSLSPNHPMANQKLNMSPLSSLNVEAAAAEKKAAMRKSRSAAFENNTNYGGLAGPRGNLPKFTNESIKAYGNRRKIALFGPQKPSMPPPRPPVASVAPKSPAPPVAPKPPAPPVALRSRKV